MNNKSLKKNKIRILLLEGIHQSAVDVLLRAGYDNIEQVATALPEAELIEKNAYRAFCGYSVPNPVDPSGI